MDYNKILQRCLSCSMPRFVRKGEARSLGFEG